MEIVFISEKEFCKGSIKINEIKRYYNTLIANKKRLYLTFLYQVLYYFIFLFNDSNKSVKKLSIL